MSTAAVCNQPVRRGGHLILSGQAASLHLAQTLDCGQAFRWSEQPDGSFTGVAYGKALRLYAENDDLVLCNISLEDYRQVWQRYFDLERDYDALKTWFSADEILREAIHYAPGIRVLRQEPWETLCTFIISANNNIPRIKGIVERLCMLWGEPLGDGQYAFPPAQRLAGLGEEALAPLRCGYRAGYLLDAAQRVAEGRLDLEQLELLPDHQARQALLEVRGVGPKVADCVLLFGFGRLACFPVDTWIRKVNVTLYPQGFPAAFDAYAGIAQQYLFHYARHHADRFK